VVWVLFCRHEATTVLAEWFEYLRTSQSPHARKLGYTKEAIATHARYKRCRSAWQPHLEASKEAILQAASQCKQQRKALIFGSGYLLDIPLAPLVSQFEEVELVDIVFPKLTQTVAHRLGANCTYGDITALEESDNWLDVPEPKAFLEDKTVDFVVSANLLSQLPILPQRYLEKQGVPAKKRDAFSHQLMAAHLAYLKRFDATRCLITDTHYLFKDQQGNLLQKTDALHGVKLPKPERQWPWLIAPMPELSRQYNRVHEVATFSL
ncbi:MAG: hypothetical protein ACPG80_01140, partial [Rickettsiales bacterium]